MRRLVVVSLLVFAVATSVAAAATRPAWREYEDPVLGWRFWYPTAMRLGHFQGFNRITWYGVAIANFPAVEPSTWPLQSPKVPPDGVLVRFWHQEGGPSHHALLRDDRLPLSLRRMLRLPVGPRPRPRLGIFQFGGIELRVAVWTGRLASRRDTAAAAEIVRRFRPAPLRTGTSTRPCDFFVLDRIRAYGARAVRRYDAGDLPENDCLAARPFFLVKTPRALYAVGWPRDSVSGYKEDCGVQFDERRFGFSCANGARWDRLGRVVSVPRGWRGGEDPLARYTVVRGYDGHVLVSTGSYRYPVS